MHGTNANTKATSLSAAQSDNDQHWYKEEPEALGLLAQPVFLRWANGWTAITHMESEQNKDRAQTTYLGFRVFELLFLLHDLHLKDLLHFFLHLHHFHFMLPLLLLKLSQRVSKEYKENAKSTKSATTNILNRVATKESSQFQNQWTSTAFVE